MNKQILEFPDIRISHDDDGWYYVTNAFDELLKTKDKDAALVAYRALYTLEQIETALTADVVKKPFKLSVKSLLMLFYHLDDERVVIPHATEIEYE